MELIELVNFIIILNDLTQIVNFPTSIPHFDSHSAALLDLSQSSDASICSTVAFRPLGTSNHIFMLVQVGMDVYIPH